jgi:hypothetical protein
MRSLSLSVRVEASGDMSKEGNQMRAVGDEHLRVEKGAIHRGMDGR